MARKQNQLREQEGKELRVGQLLGSLQPVISMVIMTSGLVVWAFNTFAQITYVEKQNSELKNNIESLSKSVKSIEDQLPKALADAIDKAIGSSKNYSDSNREKILPAVNEVKDGLKEVKDSVKSLENRLLVPISSIGGPNGHRGN